MDIDGSGTYSDDISQWVMNGVDVVAVSSRSRNSLSINEPDPNRRPLVNLPVSGKRKRKMDDVPLCVGEGMLADSVVALCYNPLLLKFVMSFRRSSFTASCTMPASPFKGFMSNEDTQSVFTVPSCSMNEQTPTTAAALSGKVFLLNLWPFCAGCYSLVLRFPDIKPSDIGKAIHVKVYRKWTIAPVIGSRRSTLYLILLDQQVRLRCTKHYNVCVHT